MYVSVFGSSTIAPGEGLYAEATALGRSLAEAGHVVLTGGYHGLMEAVSRGAASAGGHVVGVTSPKLFPDREGPNEWVIEEVVADTLAGRIAELVDRADLVIALPGSVGTFAELVTAINAAHISSLAGDEPLPLLAVGSAWSEWLDAIGTSFGVDPDLVSRVISVDEAISWLAVPR